ncbi:TonB-dependent siderophore receptor [Marinobacterium aestuariivivens]|uniref:TonB-dependent siderophore receptor n=1 Tax=Marinobacterium aestuariivivens TaxID=1698799 RepID=A0ABW1ZXJ3_9GAMM
MAFRKQPLAICVLTALGTTAATGLQAAEQQQEVLLQTLNVSGVGISAETEHSESYRAPLVSSATRLELTPRETPQAMATVTRAQIEDFSLDTLNEVLDFTPGVSVERVETDRTYYTARGFDITNFQVDGLGVPSIYDNIYGDLDTATFDRVEVLRGANGLLSGTGSPSATVNLVRKRPTDSFQASVDAGVGSWDHYRLQGDVAGPLNDAGTVRGRLVAVADNGGSYLDRYEKERNVLYGVVEADLGKNTLLTLGHTEQRDYADSPLWGALPMQFTDGTPTDYDVSTSTSTDWAYWDNATSDTFVELKQQLANDWYGIARLTRIKSKSYSKLFYVYGAPDTDTGLGLSAYPSRYDFKSDQLIADFYATGPFSLGGREHDLVLGAQWYESEVWDESNYGRGIGTALDPLEDFDGDYPEPAFDAAVAGSEWEDEQTAVYGAARWSLTDRLSLITGLRVTSLDSEGQSYGTRQDTSYDNELTPYAGAVYDLNDTWSAYVSYTEIFDPQSEVDINRKRLEPIEGSNYEVGLKADLFDGRAYGALAVFRSQQENVAEAAGTIPGSVDTYYVGVDGMTSEGFELDLAGEVLPGLQALAGYTYVDIEDADGNGAKKDTPHHLLKLATNYRLQSLPQLRVGAAYRWQDEVSSGAARQDSYGLLDLMAMYEFTPNLSATLNLNNGTDEKYLNSVRWDQAYYGAPRNAMLKLNWTY